MLKARERNWGRAIRVIGGFAVILLVVAVTASVLLPRAKAFLRRKLMDFAAEVVRNSASDMIVATNRLVAQ